MKTKTTTTQSVRWQVQAALRAEKFTAAELARRTGYSHARARRLLKYPPNELYTSTLEALARAVGHKIALVKLPESES